MKGTPSRDPAAGWRSGYRLPDTAACILTTMGYEFSPRWQRKTARRKRDEDRANAAKSGTPWVRYACICPRPGCRADEHTAGVS